MRRHLMYLRYVARHKRFVLEAGRRLGVPLWQLLIHDWTKFLPREWRPYAECFYAPDGSSQYKPSPAFAQAWNFHQKLNPHHWQFWLLTWDDPSKNYQRYAIQSHGDGYPLSVYDFGADEQLANEVDDDYKEGTVYRALRNLTDRLNAASPQALPMPERYVREMVADWVGAGRALGKPDTRGWYEANRRNIVLHPDSRAMVERLLAEVAP